MADNITLNPGTGGPDTATDQIPITTGPHYQRVKLIHGIDGTNDGDVAQTNPLPVDAREIKGVALDVNAGTVSAGTQRVVLPSDQASLTVDQAVSSNLRCEEASAASILTTTALIDDMVHARNAAFSKSAAIGGELDDTAPSIPTEGQVAPIRITAQRAAHTNLRNNAGTEVGTAGAPLRTDPTGATTQPVSDGGGSITIDGAVTANPGTGDFLSVSAHTRNEAFKESMAIGGELDDTASTSATEGNVSPVRITPERAFHVNLRSDGGTEIGTSGNPVRTDPTGTTTQPVTANAGTGDFLSVAAHTRNEAFKEAMAIGGELDDTASTSAVENAVSPVRITAERGFHVNLRTDGGVEIGTSGSPIRIDPTGTTTQPVSVAVALPAGTNNIGDVDIASAIPAGTNNIGDVDIVGSTVAHGAADANGPIKVGHKAIAHGTNPTPVAAADRTDSYANRAGIPFFIGGHPNVITEGVLVTDADGPQADVAIVTVVAGTKIVVTRVSITCDNANTASPAIIVGFGATVVPAPTTTGAAGILVDHRGVPPGGGITVGDGSGILGVGGDGQDLRYDAEDPVGGSLSITVSYYTVPS